MKLVCRSIQCKNHGIPSRFPHQSPDCPPFNSCQLPCFQVGKRLLETQAEFIVTLKKGSGRKEKSDKYFYRELDQPKMYR